MFCILQVYSGLQSCIGLMNFLSDGFSWSLLKCIHGDQKVHSAQRFVALKADCNSKLAVSLTIMEECFLPMVDPRTGIDMIPHVVYNWGWVNSCWICAFTKESFPCMFPLSVMFLYQFLFSMDSFGRSVRTHTYSIKVLVILASHFLLCLWKKMSDLH